MLNKILIANRGEIACRIIKTCKSLGIGTVAVYSTADKNSLHAKQADQAIWIGEAEPSQSYLAVKKIINAAKETGAEAIHPGYGFVAENADFARSVESEGIVFIGPAPDTIRLMGDKVKAKHLAKECGVPLVPGISDLEKLDEFLKEHGFPILIKAAAGGGGRGMRKVYRVEDLEHALRGAEREAKAFFKDGTLFIEKLIEDARHVEVQIFGDGKGDAFHIFDRDCTAQRKHQKVIEEAPAPIPKSISKAIRQSAVKLAKKARYRNAGTVEFLLAPDGSFYFMEVNSRLQVEHPVTEEISGVDLVELQIKAAEGVPFRELKSQIPKKERGTAIELRICAESPSKDFASQTGKIWVFDIGTEHDSIRIDTGIEEGSIISHYYDSLVAKVIARGSTRQKAIERAVKALDEFHICGIETNIPFLREILNSGEFLKGIHHINFSESLLPNCARREEYSSLAAIAFVLSNFKPDHTDIWDRAFGWKVYAGKITALLQIDAEEKNIELEQTRPNAFIAKVNGEEFEINEIRLLSTNNWL
ncbi:MAG: ATP-grasp domain-containing protein, partial [Candidatus Dadabacteria bacterium]